MDGLFLLTVAMIKANLLAKENWTHSNPSEAGSYCEKVIFSAQTS